MLFVMKQRHQIETYHLFRLALMTVNPEVNCNYGGSERYVLKNSKHLLDRHVMVHGSRLLQDQPYKAMV